MKQLFWAMLNFPNKIYNFFLLRYRKVVYPSDLFISGKLCCVANKPAAIQIGHGVSINSCRSANPIGGDTQTSLFAKGNGEIKIGNNVGMSNVSLFACESITIGNDVLLGGSVKIYDTDFHWLDFEKRMRAPEGETKPVVIKDGAFIGAHSIVLKGVTIGEKSIVGAGSVVTKSIPDGEIWAGNPAKFIRAI